MKFLSTPSARRATNFHFRRGKHHPDFYPRPPRGGRHVLGDFVRQANRFLSTPSARRATARTSNIHLHRSISIHALREEGDSGRRRWLSMPYNFYPRPPRGGRRFCFWMLEHRIQFLSTPSARRATKEITAEILAIGISIHALREEGDLRPCAAPDLALQFLSTPSARRATGPKTEQPRKQVISIHALREEGDPRLYRDAADASNFYPRPPRGGRLEYQDSNSDKELISIHALREEGDQRIPDNLFFVRDFYPRPPRGGRLFRSICKEAHHEFLSTPSARRATGRDGNKNPQDAISIHALREEGDRQPEGWIYSDKDFYPRPPRGGRLTYFFAEMFPARFLSTPSARRATVTSAFPSWTISNFYPRPPRGGRQDAIKVDCDGIGFLSTPSARRATCRCWSSAFGGSISIHALREEGDTTSSAGRKNKENFYPRPPRGGRRVQLVENIVDSEFLSTPSARRATLAGRHQRSTFANFYPRPPRGGRQQKQRQNLYFQTNYTTFCTNLEEP